MKAWRREFIGLVLSSTRLMCLSELVLTQLAAATTPAVEVTAANEDLRQSVQSALHLDPYVFDKHITVLVRDGRIVLSGFVYNGWDLQSALRIARRTAGLVPVVDDLEIKLGGLP